ncbi:TfoX/Sxy family protein [Clostridium uliginosum]|uniref:DNA transformation protein n=1 Tax=Clostridium uliginosum TaxID=119641 RepID=A0A1I1P6Z1_9CLOT|nr:TfoX/Sxy family protein [Clostridium uliginosum]SFD03418.1 DNA transformation protein [Clostridium uliginosum]
MGELSKLPNIGKILEGQLNEVGIETVEQLKQIGSRQTWLNIKKIDKSACFNRLCALEGAIQGIRWHSLSDEVKNELKEFYKVVK